MHVDRFVGGLDSIERLPEFLDLGGLQRRTSGEDDYPRDRIVLGCGIESRNECPKRLAADGTKEWIIRCRCTRPPRSPTN